MTRELDARELHAEADAEERDLVLARESNRRDLALGAACAEAGRDEDAVVLDERRRAELLEILAVDVPDLDAAIVRDPAVKQRFVEALVALDELDVLADEPARDLLLRLRDARDDLFPRIEPRRARPDVEVRGKALIEALLRQQ